MVVILVRGSVTECADGAAGRESKSVFVTTWRLHITDVKFHVCTVCILLVQGESPEKKMDREKMVDKNDKQIRKARQQRLNHRSYTEDNNHSKPIGLLPVRVGQEGCF